MRTHVLIYVEDPGAANYVADLPPALARRGVSVVMLAGGAAQNQLRDMGCAFEPLPKAAKAEAILQETAARFVLAGTSEDRDSFGLTLIAAARDSGIPTLGVIDGPSHPGERFRGRGKSPLEFAPERVLVPDDATRESFLSLGMPAEAVIATGHPLFDRVRATRARLDAEGSTAVRRRLFPAVPAEWPIVTFLAEISDGLRSEMFRRHAAYSLTGRGGSDARTDIVIEEFLESSRALNAYRVLRLHPKNNAEEFADYRAEFDAINDDGTPHDLIYASDLVVGMTTMLLVEAVLLGRPTVSIVPDPAEAAWLPTAASGITPVVSRRDDLAGILQAGLHARLDEAAVERALPAGSVERIIEIIVAMLGRGASGNWRPEKESA